MASFIGEFESTLDAKGRFLLPVGIKKQLPEGMQNEFVINRGFDECLTLYTAKSWKTISHDIEQLNGYDDEQRGFQRFFLNGATSVLLDNSGRILIQRKLIDYAKLERDIIVVSMFDKFEIWDAKKYQQFFETFSPKQFSEMAKKIMTSEKNAAS